MGDLHCELTQCMPPLCRLQKQHQRQALGSGEGGAEPGLALANGGGAHAAPAVERRGSADGSAGAMLQQGLPDASQARSCMTSVSRWAHVLSLNHLHHYA